MIEAEVPALLSEKERKTLEDIERHLNVEDPKLARALVHGTSNGSGRWSWGRITVVTLLAALVAVMMVALVFALSLLALGAAVLVGAVLGGQWLHREWSVQQRRRRRAS